MLLPWKMMLAERIDPHSDIPLYMQIIHALIHDSARRWPQGLLELSVERGLKCRVQSEEHLVS